MCKNKELEREVEWHQEVKVVFVMARGRELVEVVYLIGVKGSLETLKLGMILITLNLNFKSA